MWLDQFDVIGELIEGKYKVEAELGEGGMGTVYRARIVRTARPVAIKVLRKDVVGVEQYESRFAAEALMTARIKHPNVIELIEHGYLRDGRPYLVLELLTGRSLGDILRTSERIEWRRALAIIREAALGLGAVHAQQIVHRDLKPENIFLLPKQGGETVKIMDFGLAKSLDAEEEDMDLTRPGFAIGTPAYMAPERVTGDYDGRSDLYGIMVVAYELLTGKPPFTGHGTDVLREHLTKVAPSLREANSELVFPETLEWLLSKALDKKVDQRHQSAAELVRDIDHVLNDEHATLPTAKPTIERATERAASRSNRPTAKTAKAMRAPPSPLRARAWLLAGAAALLLMLVIGVAMSGAKERSEVASGAVGVQPSPEAIRAAKETEQEAADKREDMKLQQRDEESLQAISDSLQRLGFKAVPSEEAPVTNNVSLTKARRCRSGQAQGLAVLACVFASPKLALEAQQRFLALRSDATTSVALARGRALLWIADEQDVDPEGRVIQALIDRFPGAQ